MKKHEKNNAYDDSDDEKNPYASSVSLRSFIRLMTITKFMIELWCLVSGGGARGGTTCHPARPCHHRSRASSQLTFKLTSSSKHTDYSYKS